MTNFEKVPHFNSRSCQILLFNIGYFLGKSITLQEQKTNTKENKLTENFFFLFWIWAFFSDSQSGNSVSQFPKQYSPWFGVMLASMQRRDGAL